MDYLAASEYEAYGLDKTTPGNWITAASALMDAHCRRQTLGIAEYSERIRLVQGCYTTRLTYLPLSPLPPATSAITSARVRYGTPRRGDLAYQLAADVATAFGLTGSWMHLDPASVEADGRTGDVTIAPHALGLDYMELEVTYTAGLESIPNAVKVACAQIVRNAQATPALTVRSNGMDRMHMEYFADSLMDADVRKLLAPFVAQKVG